MQAPRREPAQAPEVGQVVQRTAPDTRREAARHPAPAETAKSSGSLISRLFPRPPRASRPRDTTDIKGKQRVYVLREGQPEAVSVTTGSTDGIMTEIAPGAIEVGTEVITDVISASP